MKEMTAEELSSCTGKDGKPVYIAFQGKVYDVSKSPLWSTGLHMKRHPGGKDLTSELSAAPHSSEVLERFSQAATLRKEPSEELKHLPPMLQNILEHFPMARRHPHPMVVHFPIAFLMGASLFVLLRLLCASPSVELTSFYLLILGAISSPFAMGTGLFTWWVNYRLRHTHFIKRKLQLSVFLLIFLIILILWRSANPRVILDGIHPVYFIMMLLLAPIVGLLGYYGGQMTFPDEK